MKNLFVTIGILLSSAVVQADILFIDMNNSPQEIEAARKAARQRGERLIVYPNYDRETKTRIRDAGSQMSQAARDKARACGRNGTPDACTTATSAHKASEDNYNKVTKSVPRITKAGLTNGLRQLKNQNVTLTSVILSGHDGNGWFGGVYGDVYDKDIAAAFKSVPPMADSVRSFLPWGCYTTTVGSAEYKWKKVFPSATMIAGFDGSAPLANRPANWAYLEQVLVKEKELTEARDKQTLTNIFNSIPHIGDRSMDMTAAICLNGDTVVSKNGVKSIKEEIAKCKLLQKDSRDKMYACYLRADKGCEDVPANTKRSELRSYYNYLQDTEHCDDVLTEMGHERPLTDEVLRLMFDKNVRGNFENLHKAELAKINDLIRELGLPSSLLLENLGGITRKQFLDKVNGIKRQFNARSNAIKNERGVMDDPKLLALNLVIPELHKLYNYQCVPENWIDPGSATASSCKIKEGLSSVFRKGEALARRARGG